MQLTSTNFSYFAVRGMFFVLIMLTCGVARAFPPAPSYTLYGMVRDQAGQTVSAENCHVILLKDGVETGRTPIISGKLDLNYELEIRIDQNRSGTALYNSRAIESQGLFSLVVSMNGALYYPIEVAGTLKAGKGSERVRLDLTLGEDKDLDGLPDVWEQWQLYQAGHLPDANGGWDLSLIGKNGDFDKDGQSNFMEYLAGTFAGDETERFELLIKEKQAAAVRFEFYAITGKTYTIERSDGGPWSRIPFSITEGGEPATAYTAASVGVRPVFAVPEPGGKREFFRLTVR